MSSIRVLVADDHETVREGLRAILATDPEIAVVGEAADGHAALAGAQSLRPDVVLMDVTMPGLNGFQTTQAIRDCCPDTNILVLTRHAQEAYVHEFLRVGAAGYVLKQSRSNELLHAVHAVASGEKYVDRSLSAQVQERARSRPAITPGAPRTAPPLSPREEQVLRLVALGYSNKEIAATLEVSVKTIEAHKANAGQKLGLATRADVVRYAHMRGWLAEVG